MVSIFVRRILTKGMIDMKFGKTALVASAAILSLGLAACDLQAENQAEKEVEGMEAGADLQVEAQEEAGAITDDQADAMKDQIDAQADSADKALDETDPDTATEAEAVVDAQ